MRATRSMPLVVALAGAAVACSEEAWRSDAADPAAVSSAVVLPAGHDARSLPIHGYVSGSVSASVLSAGTFRLEVRAAGVVSQLGRVAASLVFPNVEFVLGQGAPIIRSGTWTGVLEAANGDLLFGEYTMRDESLAMDAAGRIQYEADLVITGGTGRFQGASGHAFANGVAHVFQRRFEGGVTGTISVRGH